MSDHFYSRADIARMLREQGDIPDELRKAMRESLEGPERAETLEPCVACRDCPCCHGDRLVTPLKNTEWLAKKGE